ncbi:MAG: chaperone NapD [Nitrospirota bacterium]
MNISSIVVTTTKEHIRNVIDDINSVEFCEVHFSDQSGKIVATIEGESISEQMERLKLIQNMPFVFSAALSYSYCEDELARSMEGIRSQKDSSTPD